MTGSPYVSAEAALEQGLGAYRAGVYNIALPALTYAAENKLFLGQYHLARLLADSATANTDHVRAYHLYREIVEEHAPSIDVDDDARAPYVGKALTALARYIYSGLPKIGLQPNPSRAAEFLEEAATFFREPDGQFALAKLYLKGDGVPEDRRKSLHWLSTLSQDGHAGAQAFFADLLWTGKVVAKDEKRALALIRVAVENAPGLGADLDRGYLSAHLLRRSPRNSPADRWSGHLLQAGLQPAHQRSGREGGRPACADPHLR